MNKVRIGVSGDIGSFSEEACLAYAKNAKLTDIELVYLINMQGVLSALNQGNIDIGVFPVVNNNSGLVKPAFAAMGQHSFVLIDEIALDIEQCLFAKDMLNIKEIKYIYSYAPALAQCKNFVSQECSNAELIDWGDMAKAARDLSLGQLPGLSAVIGPKMAAEVYGLKILARNIQDVKPNVTMFAVVAYPK